MAALRGATVRRAVDREVATEVTLRRDASGAAVLGGVTLDSLLQDARITTPAYVYDLEAIAEEARHIRAAFGDRRHLVAYAVKANSAGPILRELASVGTGADVVSGAELALARRAGIAPDAIVFSGVAKTDAELDAAISAGERGLLAIQAESIEELPRIEARARALGRAARVSLRINPGIEADTHAHIATGHDEAKFGIPRGEVGLAIETVLGCDHIVLTGVGNHVGSQLTATDDYLAAARMLIPVFAACDTAMLQAGRPALANIDFGGGFGIDYGTGCDVRPSDFVTALVHEVARAGLAHVRIVVEPGRSLVAAHGVLCASVIMSKRAGASGHERRWLMIDAGMNDLIRPALYGALHRIEATDAAPDASTLTARFRVVGPVCESSDDFGAHELPDPPPARVVVRDAGAYGFTMASQYNGRRMPTEVFLSGGRVRHVLPPTSDEAWISARLGAEPAD